MEAFGQSSVTPNIKFLTDIIEELKKGELQIPNFQRPYVWKPNDIVSLFDSIYKGYPIGSLLFWETSQVLNSFSKIGPFQIAKSSKSEVNYVIDGHQRLATLFGVLQNKDEGTSGEVKNWNLYFDLERDEFLFPQPKEISTSFISMDKVINTIDFLDECKRIQSNHTTNSNVLINKAQRLAQSIITYKVPITQIKGGDLSSAVEIFSRLNTKGWDITPDQMLSALTYKDGDDGFRLADRIDQILVKLNDFQFSEIERIFIFRSIIAASKRDIYKVKLESFAKDKKVNLSQIVDQTEEAILKTADFLYNDIGVPGDKLLPYNLQFVFLCEFFFNQDAPTESQLAQLRDWFWFTSYTGWFAGASNTKVNLGLDGMRKFAKNEEPLMSSHYYAPKQVTRFPDKFDFRYARVKSFVLFLKSLHPQHLVDHQDLDVKRTLSENGNRALHFIVPGYTNNVANRMLLGPVKVGSAKSLLQDPEVIISSEVLSSHGITNDARKALINGNVLEFFSLRNRELIRLERDFVSSKGLEYGELIDFPISNSTQIEMSFNG